MRADFAMLGLLMGMMTSCSRPETPPLGKALESVFRDFIYVGAFPDTKDPIGVHSYDPRPLPASLSTGHRYVFHFSGKLDSAKFTVFELPRRLHHVGFRVLSAPKSIDELPTVDPGDRSWSVTFEYAGTTAQISNALDLALFERGGLTPGGSFEMFILRLTP